MLDYPEDPKDAKGELRSIQQRLQAQLDAPMKLSEVSADVAPYAGIFFPGGQGTIIELPKKQVRGLRQDSVGGSGGGV